VLSRLGYAYRTARFRLWALRTQLKLKRMGGEFVLEAAGTPRCQTMPRIESNDAGASLTLRLGRDCRIGRDMVIELRAGKRGTVEFGDRVTVQNNVRLQPWGGLIQLADDCQLRDGGEIQSLGRLTMGYKTLIGRHVHVHCDERITFGARSGVAEHSTIIDSDHDADGSDTWFMDRPINTAPVDIGENTMISANSFVTKGTKIGRNCQTGAGAIVVGGEYPDGSLIVGAPARVLRPLRPSTSG
jgi:acetyltransferase-like isoleucine patch superfamily enzyme